MPNIVPANSTLPRVMDVQRASPASPARALMYMFGSESRGLEQRSGFWYPRLTGTEEARHEPPRQLWGGK